MSERERLMREVADKAFTFLCRQQDPAFVEAVLHLGGRYAARWDEPQQQEGFVLPVWGDPAGER